MKKWEKILDNWGELWNMDVEYVYRNYARDCRRNAYKHSFKRYVADIIGCHVGCSAYIAMQISREITGGRV